MFAIRVNRYLVSAAIAAVFLVGCKGHGDSSSIPQALTNWTWESGTNVANSLGYYTTQGTPTSTGQPSGRYGAMTWKDSSGVFWVFGGAGGYSDMWSFNTSTLQWNWVAGNSSSSSVTAGTYGTLGTAAEHNQPGQRTLGSTWIDASGNFWMFGGYGSDASGLIGYTNDMWSYSPSTNWWTWQAGPSSANSTTYSWGTQGVASSSNLPNPRDDAAHWTSTSGMFYMFGGNGYINNESGQQNDLWQFNPTTKQWTWISGSQALNQAGVYGSATGNPSSSIFPGARQSATTWIDSSGNFWLFGGQGWDSGTQYGTLNDLWKFNPTTNQWTWVSGSQLINAIGAYGTNDVASTANYPGGRSGAAGWIDGSNNLWVFGGNGINSSGTYTVLNDLWEYQVSTGAWVWVNGSYNGAATGYYGTLGVLANGNMPGSRFAASSWNDSVGNFWMFGGRGYDAVGSDGRLSDTWKFLP